MPKAVLNFDYIVIIVAVRSSFYASKPWATTSNSYFPIPRPPLSMQPHWPSYGSMVMWIYANSVPFTDAQKFKGKFDDCKEEVRKALEGTGTWNLKQISYVLTCQYSLFHTLEVPVHLMTSYIWECRLTLFFAALSSLELFLSATSTCRM